MNEVLLKAAEIRSAIQHSDLEKVVALIEADLATLQMMTPFGTWLHLAATAGTIDIVKYLVDAGIEVNTRGGTFKGSAINLAASNGHIEIVRYLLEQGAEMDVSEPERNPLFAAIYGGNLAVVELLVSSGIDYCVKYTGESMTNMDAIAFAYERGQKEIADYLLEVGCR